MLNLEAHSLNTLHSLGLNFSTLRPALAALDWSDDARLWRLTEVHRDAFGLQAGDASSVQARALPALTQTLHASGENLCVGDWVLTRRNSFGDHWIHARATPLNTLTRRDPEGRRQALVSNVDLAVLVMGLDHDFKLARLDRYLVLTHSAGVPALIVLSKADLCADASAKIAEVREHLGRSRGGLLDILAVDGNADSARTQLSPWLGLGQTLVLLGSSGAGKSTLTNTLCQAELQLVGGVREDDSRGRHTTTSRSLKRCVGGACIIDTPGLRSLQLDADVATLRLAFDDVGELAAECKFRNCSHQGEPGCAVREALSPARLKSFQKLQREAARDQMTHLDKREQLAARKIWGRIGNAAVRAKRGD
ncbi:ribosome small subunit-dependent GTPase A [Roseateles oligotrophus]|uniref:Small ribosomal subunit biogenesis GTPase RsgA n=1 Tax=Roseateles oligotrophus TaxID=1769250 RepID=A0ABT2YIQ6_9BURK|nr:ribosome small subunit-dependent GTPase A [Roseateles oligotrophus]MCV2369944.1 ribosome small subunit-dependent GTPase A [Roseateles oligotrophus]